jgi:hypothetical protein
MIRCLGSDLLDFVGVLCVEQHDLLAKVAFDVAADVHGHFRVDEIDGDAMLAEASGSSDAVQVGFAVSLVLLIDGKIEVHDDVDLVDVNATRQDVRGDQDLLVAFAEAIEDGETLIDGEITGQNSDGFAADFLRHLPSEPPGGVAGLQRNCQ